MRTLIAHDYLTQTGGAERVALSMVRGFTGASLVTSAYDPSETFPGFSQHDIRTLSFSSRRLIHRDVRLGLPFLAGAFSRARTPDADVVLCSSSGWSHHLATAAPKIVYCHNVPRWLYQPEDYLLDQGRIARSTLRALKPRLVRQDVAAALGCARYLANSRVVADRLNKFYGLQAEVVHPPLSLNREGSMSPVPGLKPGYWLVVARKRAYKNTQAVIDAAALQGRRLVVVGGEREPAAHVTRLAGLSDSTLRWLYANASATIAAAYEDFGLTPLESNLFGTPVLALRTGGYLETVVEGKTGLFFDESSPASILDAMHRFEDVTFSPDDVSKHTDQFSEQRFIDRLHAVCREVLGDQPAVASGTAAGLPR